MNGIFLDTVGFLALWNARDQGHTRAVEVFADLTARGADFYTTTYILLECGNAASRTPFRGAVVEIREQLLADGKLIEPSKGDCETAWKDYAAGGAGIVDHVSFAVLRRLGMVEVFTNDALFRTAGFKTLF